MYPGFHENYVGILLNQGIMTLLVYTTDGHADYLNNEFAVSLRLKSFTAPEYLYIF